MKRKVIQQNPTTLVVSLPAKWARQKSIKKGDEIDVIEKEDSLIISKKAEPGHKKIEIDATNLYPLAKRIVANKYIEGADEIIITSQKPERIKDIPDIVKTQLIGFEVIEQTRNKIVMKEISTISDKEFDNMLRRLFLLIKMMGQDLIKAIEQDEKDFDFIIKQDENVNRFTNYCLRMVNKRIKPDLAENSALYAILYLLENLADNYKDLVKINKENINKELLKGLDQINKFFNSFIELFYGFNTKKATEFGNQYEQIKKVLKKTKVITTEQAGFLANLQEMLNYIILMLNNVLNYEKV